MKRVLLTLLIVLQAALGVQGSNAAESGLKLGDGVTAHGIEVSLDKTDRTTGLWIGRAAIMVTNTGDAPAIFDPFGFVLLDQDGRVYMPSVEYSILKNIETRSKNPEAVFGQPGPVSIGTDFVNPGVSARYDLYFVMPYNLTELLLSTSELAPTSTQFGQYRSSLPKK